MALTTSDGGIQLLGKTLLEKDFVQIQEIYGEDDLFPLEVRLQLSDWIEEQFIPLVSTGRVDMLDPAHQQIATNIATGLIQQLDSKIQIIPNETDKFLTKIKLQKVSANLKQSFGNNPVGLYNAVIEKLEKEMQLVAQVPVDAIDAALAEMTAESQSSNRIRQQLSILKQKINETATQLGNCRTEHEQFSVEYYACKENANRLQALQLQNGEEDAKVKAFKTQKEALEKQIKARYVIMQRHQTQLINDFVNTYNSVKEVQTQVLDVELVRWTKEQQMGGNGFQINPTFIDTLQEWCEGLAEVIWPLRQQVKQLEELKAKLISEQQSNPVNLQELVAGITELLSTLVTRTFVIEKQPPQVMKTNTRFPATVRLLVAGVLNIHMAAPVVSASIVSETQAYQLASASPGILKRKEDYNSGDILNNQGTMEFHAETRRVSVSFKNLQLKKIKRTEKKGTECVMDEKFSILFWTEFALNDLKFQLWTFSLPVVVIVHGNQESQALATVVWDNGFAELGRRLFYVPEKVTWGQAAEVLNMKWAAACGGSLTEDNLYCLACKALRDTNIPKIPEDYNNRILTWSLFCKETLPNRTFTFWEWFYRILLLTSSHMKNLWTEGCIMGFVMKQEAERILKQQQNGCFLLRYSDSELGGVTIAYVRRSADNQAPSVLSLYPFTTKDLAQRSMADVVFDINELTFLYPSITKEVFRKHCGTSAQEKKPGNPGYIKHTFVTQLQGAGASDTPPEIKYEIGSPAQSDFGMWDSLQQSNIPTAITGGFDETLLNAQYSVGDDMEMGDIDLAGLIDVSDIINLASPGGPQFSL